MPPEQVIGSSIEGAFEGKGELPVRMRRPEVDVIDDEAGEPVATNTLIGRRPIATPGGPAADRELLEKSGAGGDPPLMMLVCRDDADRESAYGPAAGCLIQGAVFFRVSDG